MSSSFTALPAGVSEQLPGAWKLVCDAEGTSCFAWAHKGSTAGTSWVQLLLDGVLLTKWGKGTWKAVEGDAGMLELKFGGVRHMCAMRGASPKFEVVQRIRFTTGEDLPHPTLQGGSVLSAGWPIHELPASQQKVQEAVHEESAIVTPPRKRKSPDELSPSSAPDRKRRCSGNVAAATTPAAQGFNVFLLLAQAQKPKDRTPKSVMGRLKAHYDSLGKDEQGQYKDTYRALQVDYKHAANTCPGGLYNVRAKLSKSPEASTECDKTEIHSPLPKKPVAGAWGVFLNEVRPKIKAEAATTAARSIAAVTKAAKSLWDDLDEAARAKYQEEYESLKAAYDAAIQQHKEAQKF